MKVSELILERLEVIEQRLTRIEADLDVIKTGTYNMNKHITFIETLYETMRIPIDRLLSFFKN